MFGSFSLVGGCIITIKDEFRWYAQKYQEKEIKEIITRIALTILQAVAYAAASFFLPIPALVLGIAFYATVRAIEIININRMYRELATEKKTRDIISENTVDKMLKTVGLVKKVQTIKTLFRSSSIIMACIANPLLIPPVFLLMTIEFLEKFFTLNIFMQRKTALVESKIAELKILKEAYTLHQEQVRLKEAFPHNFKEMQELETLHRKDREQYFKRVEVYIGKAIDEIYKKAADKKEFVQNLDDLFYETYNQVSKLAIIYEIESNSSYTPFPSYLKRFSDFEELKESYFKLPAEKSEQVREIALNQSETGALEDDIKTVVNRISNLAHLLQRRSECFANPIRNFTEKYYLKRFDLKNYFAIQKEKLVNFKNTLFFQNEKTHTIHQTVHPGHQTGF